MAASTISRQCFSSQDSTGYSSGCPYSLVGYWFIGYFALTSKLQISTWFPDRSYPMINPETNGSMTQCSMPTRSLITGFKSAFKWIVIMVSPMTTLSVWIEKGEQSLLTSLFSITFYAKMLSNSASGAITPNNVSGLNTVFLLRGAIFDFGHDESISLLMNEDLNFRYLNRWYWPALGSRMNGSYEFQRGRSLTIVWRWSPQTQAEEYCGSSGKIISVIFNQG